MLRLLVLLGLIVHLSGCGSDTCDFKVTCEQVRSDFEPANESYVAAFEISVACPQCDRRDAACWNRSLGINVEFEFASCDGDSFRAYVGPAGLAPLCAHPDLAEVGIGSPECDVHD